MLYCKNISAVAVSPARLAYLSRGEEGSGRERAGGSEAGKEKAKIDPTAAALDVAERGIAADAAEEATTEAKAKGGAKFDYAARAIFDSEQEDLGRAVDDVRVTEQLLGEIDPSLVGEEDGLKAYERILGLQPSDKELQPSSVFAKMVSLAIKDLQGALKVKPDGRFGGETLGALLRQGTNKQAPDIVRNAYAHLQISPVANPNALLAKIDSGRAGRTAGVAFASGPLAATIETGTAEDLSREERDLIGSVDGKLAEGVEGWVNVGGVTYHVNPTSVDGVPGVQIGLYGEEKFYPQAQIDAVLGKAPTARVGLASGPLAATIETAETTVALNNMPDQDKAVLLALANYGYHGSGSLPAGGKLLEYSHNGDIGKTVVSETQDGGVSFFVNGEDKREYSAEIVAAFMERNSR